MTGARRGTNVRRVLVGLTTLASAMVLPLVASAAGAEHGEHGIDVGTLALQLFNFGVLLFILIKFGGRALSKALQARHEQLKGDLEDAERLRAEAEARMAEQARRLQDLEAEMGRMREQIKKDAASEKVRLVAAAEARARRVQEETKFLLEQQIKQAELAFRAEVATAAARIAEELVRKSVGPDDQRRLVDGFIGDVETARSASDVGARS